MNLNQLLCEASISPATTLCMRHRPVEAKLRRTFMWLASERPDVFNAYQSTQRRREEQQLLKAAHLAAFIGDRPGRAVFVGLYRCVGHRITSVADRRKIASWTALTDYGITDKGQDQIWFDLKRTRHFAEWSGKLVIEWKSERSWSRWADKNVFEILAINEESVFAEELPNWRDMVLSWNDLKIIPTRWRNALREWRGIYFIFDVSQNKGYVGSAYGSENICGRWENYAKTGHGGNKLLRDCKPENLRFSILERLSPDTPADETIQRENTWKERLHTRQYGLNVN